MGNPSDAGRSQGDVMYRLQELERKIADLQTARRGEAMSIGRGGIRVQGGRLLAEDSSSERIFEVTTEPPGIFMQQELIASLTREILGEAIAVDTNVETGTTTIENEFVDLEFAGSPNPGPSIQIEVGPSGRALAFTGANINVIEFGSGAMSFAGSGPESIEPTSITGAFNSVNLPAGNNVRVGSMGIRFLTGLTPGTYTLTAKYNVSNQSLGGGISFSNRVLLAIPF